MVLSGSSSGSICGYERRRFSEIKATCCAFFPPKHHPIPLYHHSSVWYFHSSSSSSILIGITTHTSHHISHNRQWWTFFKQAYFFPQKTQEWLLATYNMSQLKWYPKLYGFLFHVRSVHPSEFTLLMVFEFT